MPKAVLGRGLNALLGGSGSASVSPGPVAPPGESVLMMALDRVRPCPFQPRKYFSDEAIQELADSIKIQGILQPLIVREQGDVFELIAGERRWRAARAAGLLEVPIIVREADDRKVLELALIENLQRENLNAIEEALGYSELIRQFDLTQDAVAVRVGKSRASVANALRLLRLAPEIQSHVRNNRLSVGHAKVILGLPDGEQQMLAIARAIMNQPRLVLLDEPTLGLAPMIIDEVLDIIRTITATGTGVLLAEQNVGPALRVAEDVIVLVRGSSVHTGPARVLSPSQAAKLMLSSG